MTVKVMRLDKITLGMNKKEKNIRSEPYRNQGDGKICREAWGGAAGKLEENQTIWHPENQEKKMP